MWTSCPQPLLNLSPTPPGTKRSEPAATDSDGDGATDSDEVDLYGTDPETWDTDGDGLSDGDELLRGWDRSLLWDTNGDGASDGGVETAVDSESVVAEDAAPVATDDATTTSADSDTDRLADADEAAVGTDPTSPDSDGDAYYDGDEVNLHTGSTRPGELPYWVGLAKRSIPSGVVPIGLTRSTPISLAECALRADAATGHSLVNPCRSVLCARDTWCNARSQQGCSELRGGSGAPHQPQDEEQYHGADDRHDEAADAPLEIGPTSGEEPNQEAAHEGPDDADDDASATPRSRFVPAIMLATQPASAPGARRPAGPAIPRSAAHGGHADAEERAAGA